MDRNDFSTAVMSVVLAAVADVLKIFLVVTRDGVFQLNERA